MIVPSCPATHLTVPMVPSSATEGVPASNCYNLCYTAAAPQLARLARHMHRLQKSRVRNTWLSLCRHHRITITDKLELVHTVSVVDIMQVDAHVRDFMAQDRPQSEFLGGVVADTRIQPASQDNPFSASEQIVCCASVCCASVRHKR
jgi:hypothetical protein